MLVTTRSRWSHAGRAGRNLSEHVPFIPVENDGIAEPTEGDDLRQILGLTVRRLRRGRGWSQEDLAGRMTSSGHSMGQTTIAKMEAGSRPTTVDELFTLSQVFGVHVTSFMRSTAGEEHLEAVQLALTELQAIKNQIRDINIQITGLQKQRKALAPLRSDALKKYHAARKAAGLSTDTRTVADGPED